MDKLDTGVILCRLADLIVAQSRDLGRPILNKVCLRKLIDFRLAGASVSLAFACDTISFSFCAFLCACVFFSICHRACCEAWY